MKKILITYIVFVASLLFYVSYDSYNYMNYARISNIKNEISDNSIACQIDVKDTSIMEQMLNSINEFAHRENTEFVLAETIVEDDGTMLYNRYLYAKNNDWIYDTIRMTSGNEIDFLEEGRKEGYLSSDFNDREAIGTFTSYDNTYFMHENEVYRFYNAKSSIKNMKSISFSVNMVNDENTNKLSELLVEKYGNHLTCEVRHAHGGTESDILTVYRYSDIQFALICSFAIMGIIMICIIIKDKREILIRRMNGNNVFGICIRLYSRMLFIDFFVFVLTIIVIWSVFIGKWDRYYIELFNDMKNFSIYALVAIPCLLVLSGIYIYYTVDIRELKNSQSLKIMNYLNYLFKIVMSVFLIMPFMTSLNTAIPHLNKYMYVTSNEDELSQYWSFAFSDASQEKMNEIYKNCLYVNMTDYSHMSEINSLMNPDYDAVDIMNVPLVTVNDYYLKDFDLYDLNNQKIDIASLPEKTMIIPEQYQNTELTPKRMYKANHTVIVKNTGTHYNLQVRESNHKLDNPIVVLIHEYTSADVQYSEMYFKASSEKEHKENLEYISRITQKPYRLLNSKSDINNYLISAQQVFIELFSKLFIYGFVYILFVLQFMTLYIQEERKEMSLQYMVGKSRWDRYGNIYLTNLCIYMCIILLAVIWQGIPFEMCIQFSLIAFVFDSILMTIFIKRFERKSIALSLKGEY